MHAEAPRYNVYALIHKALRLAMTKTLPVVGRLDASDAAEVTGAIVRVRELLAFCKHHLEVENTMVHPFIEAAAPGTTARIAAEHVQHEASLAALERSLEALARAPAATRAAAASDLYAKLAHFVGENLVHMNEEETVHNAALWSAYGDEELAALENRIKSAQSPEQMKFALRWMLPAMSPAERVRLLSAVRDAAPPPVYSGMVALARAHVDASGWRKLETALAA
jgi:hemerythrin-like domain-containing protein